MDVFMLIIDNYDVYADLMMMMMIKIIVMMIIAMLM